MIKKLFSYLVWKKSLWFILKVWSCTKTITIRYNMITDSHLQFNAQYSVRKRRQWFRIFYAHNLNHFNMSLLITQYFAELTRTEVVISRTFIHQKCTLTRHVTEWNQSPSLNRKIIINKIRTNSCCYSIIHWVIVCCCNFGWCVLHWLKRCNAHRNIELY